MAFSIWPVGSVKFLLYARRSLIGGGRHALVRVSGFVRGRVGGRISCGVCGVDDGLDGVGPWRRGASKKLAGLMGGAPALSPIADPLASSQLGPRRCPPTPSRHRRGRKVILPRRFDALRQKGGGAFVKLLTVGGAVESYAATALGCKGVPLNALPNRRGERVGSKVVLSSDLRHGCLNPCLSGRRPWRGETPELAPAPVDKLQAYRTGRSPAESRLEVVRAWVGVFVLDAAPPTAEVKRVLECCGTRWAERVIGAATAGPVVRHHQDPARPPLLRQGLPSGNPRPATQRQRGTWDWTKTERPRPRSASWSPGVGVFVERRAVRGFAVCGFGFWNSRITRNFGEFWNLGICGIRGILGNITGKISGIRGKFSRARILRTAGRIISVHSWLSRLKSATSFPLPELLFFVVFDSFRLFPATYFPAPKFDILEISHGGIRL